MNVKLKQLRKKQYIQDKISISMRNIAFIEDRKRKSSKKRIEEIPHL